MELGLPALVAVWVLPVLFAITVHEVAHGFAARYFGDRTAEMLGRLTLNPLKHIDPVGTVLVPGVMLLLGGFIFGWAKPVPVAFRNLRHPKTDMAIVAAAGPAANLLMALAWAVVVKLSVVYHVALGPAALFAALIGVAGISINLILMVLNLLPIPPLDGGRVVVGVLPEPASSQFARIEPFGLFVVLGLLALGWLHFLLAPMIHWALILVLKVVGLSSQQYYELMSILRVSG